MEHDPRTLYIYETVMTWLEEPLDKTTYDLRIPIMYQSPAMPFDMTRMGEQVRMRMLLFIRGKDARGIYAEERGGCVKHRVYYDANWRSYKVIEELLRED